VRDRLPRAATMTEGHETFWGPSIVRNYEAWYEGSGRRADRLEKNLLARLLDWIDGGETLLDVGSGTCHFGRYFAHLGLQVVGVDSSVPMLREAARLGSPPTVLGDALRLPLDDLSVDLVAIVATLAFVTDPVQVVREAVRVSRRGLIIGVLNRASRLGRRVRSATDEPWRNARLLTISELCRSIKTGCGGRGFSVVWYTTIWPFLGGAMRAPWGDFIGMAVRWEDG
jgi:ubiquinone/menaquinone biosynthesis C-methylase UbiE